LFFGDTGAPQQFILENDKAYTVRCFAVAAENAGPTSASLIRQANVRQAAGVVTVTAQDTLQLFGDVTAIWSIGFTAGVAPARLVITFDTLLTTVAAFVTARVEFVETVMV
jgi:hypothetical protein